MALELLDSSSIGRQKDYERFKVMNSRIESALQTTVKQHYQEFNSSLGTYGTITQSINTSHTYVQMMRELLLQSRSDLSSKRTDLRGMSHKSQQDQEILKILKLVSYLKTVPEKFEELCASKYFLQAVDVLVSALQLINESSILEIAAVGDIRHYLSTQNSAIADVLIEELQNHLYLRSAYSDLRWTSYSPNQTDLPIIDPDDHTSRDLPMSRTCRYVGQLAYERHLSHLEHFDSGITDAAANPEVNSFSYISNLVEALYKTGRLAYAVDAIIHRAPLEVYQIFEKTTTEIESRSEYATHPVEAEVLDSSFPYKTNIGFEKLRDFLWTVYSKCDAILQSHRVLYESVERIRLRTGEPDYSTMLPSKRDYQYITIWRTLQNELYSTLQDYLAGDRRWRGRTVTDHSTHATPNNLFSNYKLRDKKQAIFHLSGCSVDNGSSEADSYELQDLLRGSVPGLIAQGEPKIRFPLVGQGSTKERIASGHVLLTASSAFNISALVPPTKAFLSRVTRVVPKEVSDLDRSISSFFDKFISDVYLPQLQKLFKEEFELAVSGDDDGFVAFARMVPEVPVPLSIAKNAFILYTLLGKVLFTMNTVADDQDKILELVLAMLSQYYQKCLSKWSSLVIRHSNVQNFGQEAPARKASAACLQNEGLKHIWREYMSGASMGAETKTSLSRKESESLLAYTGDHSLHEDDLLSQRGLQALELLYSTMKWFTGEILDLLDPCSEDSGRVWSEARQKIEQLRRSRAIYAVKNQRHKIRCSNIELFNKFYNLVLLFQDLTVTIFVTLRMELRFRTIYHLTMALTEGNYSLDDHGSEADSNIIALNKALLNFETNAPRFLANEEQAFLLSGLGSLMNKILTEKCNCIGLMNKHGASKMILQVLVLQQNLRNLVAEPSEADLQHAIAFYRLFLLGPAGLLKAIKTNLSIGFSYDELSKLMTLQYSQELTRASSDGRRESSILIRKAFNENMISLNESLWSSE